MELPDIVSHQETLTQVLTKEKRRAQTNLACNKLNDLLLREFTARGSYHICHSHPSESSVLAVASWFPIYSFIILGPLSHNSPCFNGGNASPVSVSTTLALMHGNNSPDEAGPTSLLRGAAPDPTLRNEDSNSQLRTRDTNLFSNFHPGVEWVGCRENGANLEHRKAYNRVQQGVGINKRNPGFSHGNVGELRQHKGGCVKFRTSRDFAVLI
nr:hypothetical protein Iba_chr09aCG5320 [Ipomoea batatas]